MRAGTARERILLALAAAGGPVCDDCLWLPRYAGLSRRQHANQECRRLRDTGGILREHGTCAVCGARKLTNRVSVGRETDKAPARETPPKFGKAQRIPSPAASPEDRLTAQSEFNHVCVIEPERDNAGRVCLFTPQERYAKAAVSLLHRDGNSPFCRFRVPGSLHISGVYAITVDGETRYIGKCDNLSTRFNTGYGQISPRNCYEQGQPTNCRVNRLVLGAVERGARVDLWFCADENPGPLESELITELRPSWNAQIPRG